MLDARIPEALEKCDVRFEEPFCVFEIEHFLPDSFYAALDASFPAKADFVSQYDKTVGAKRYLDNRRPEFFDFLARADAWRRLYEFFLQDDVIEKLHRLSKRSLSARRFWERGLWWYWYAHKDLTDTRKPPNRLRRAVSGALGRVPVRLGFEFSFLERSNAVPPHTDNLNKLLSLMIYFPDPGFAYGDEGATRFYRKRDGKAGRTAWITDMMDADSEQAFLADHEPFHLARFEPNKLVGFVKNACSWHAVPPPNIPESISRRSVNINIFSV